MKFILVISILGTIAIWTNEHIRSEYHRGFADALKSAYKTNPPSDQLEMVCAGLWVGEQNRKWFQRENSK